MYYNIYTPKVNEQIVNFCALQVSIAICKIDFLKKGIYKYGIVVL